MQVTTAPPRGRVAHKPVALPRLLIWIGALGIAIGILLVAALFADEPVRRWFEGQLNTRLQGYTVRIPELHVNLLRFSMTWRDASIRQDAHPEPPVLVVPTFKFGVH